MPRKYRVVSGGIGAIILAVAAVFLLNGQLRPGLAQVPSIDGCSIFPANNIWNTRVDNLPVAANSTAYINSIGAGTGLKADFGAGLYQGSKIGIPFVTVPQGQPKVPVQFDYYDESDPGPYPIPPNPPIEGGSDRHILVLERGTCLLYETFDTRPNPAGGWLAGSGAKFDLNSNALRPASWTSADAAGFAILPGLVRYEEVAAGSINHAIRFTAPQIRNSYLWPARHKVNNDTSPSLPQMGQRFRLKAGFNINNPSFSPATRVILIAMKTYGMFLADIGSAWYVSGAPNEGWDNNALRELALVKGSDFEAVDQSFLQLAPDSAQAASLAAPSGLSGSAISSTQINLGWNDNSDIEAGFYIERKTGAGGVYSQIGSAGPNVKTFQDTGRVEGTTYYYRVRAFFNYGLPPSAYTNEPAITTPLVAPANLNAAAVSISQINLSWTTLSGNTSGYYLERKTGPGGFYTQITTTMATTYQDNNLADDTTYYYRVRAYNLDTVSAYSSPANATTFLAAPQTPRNLLAWAVSTSQIRLSWQDVSYNETAFHIERSDTGQNPWSEIGGSPALSNTSNLTDTTGLAADTTYFYRVWASNGAGPSGYSNIVSATTTLLMVTIPEDDTTGATSGTLSYALQQWQPGQSIAFSLAPTNTVTFQTGLPAYDIVVRSGVVLLGDCGLNGPLLTINGSGLPAGSMGLKLSGKNILTGLRLINFPGTTVTIQGTGHHFECTAVYKGGG